MSVHASKHALSAAAVLALVVALLPTAIAPRASATITATNHTYTLNSDFDQGTLVNLSESPADQLQLNSVAKPFGFIWVAASARGTVVKIDTATGQILGEYWTSPSGRGRDPSRTTVDGDGNVWVADRAESAGGGAVVKIGLQENGQCVDRNANGVIDTSSGLGDILAWPNTGGADNNGGVSTAADECIIVYQRLPDAPGARHISVAADNSVWVAGFPYYPTKFWHLREDGAFLGSFIPQCGGYGGLIDRNGVLWSSDFNHQSLLLRYNTNTGVQECIPLSSQPYGMAIDTGGNIWTPFYYGPTVVKLAPDGTVLGQYFTNGSASRGAAVTPADDNVWVANSGSYTVSRLSNSGSLLATISVGMVPTGVAVDAAGKVWVTDQYSNDARRIDPATNLVDLTVSLGSGAGPYNYSDMTGSTLIAPPNTGTWSVVHDSGVVGAHWSDVSWNGLVPDGAKLSVAVASSADGVTFGPEVAVASGAAPAVDDAQYLRVNVTFERATGCSIQETLNCSPVLYDLTLSTNRPPTADAGTGYTGNEGASISLSGATASDPDGDGLTYAWSYATGAGVDAGATCTFSDAAVLNPSIACTDDGTFVVTLTVSDGANPAVSDTADVVVANADPKITDLKPLAGSLYAIGAPVGITATFTDAGANDTHTCAVAWDDGNAAAAGTVVESLGAGTCKATKTYTTAGVYTIGATVTDDDAGSASSETMVIVYDPSAGFVTGGGTILSPQGAYTADATLTGPANFGFVSKYQKGATLPTGQTEFQFHVAGFNFHSDAYQWLVVAGSKAQYKGTGSVNGVSGYGFLLTAVDGQLNGGGGVDKFRIKVWNGDGIVYDNVLGASDDLDAASPLAITSGNIVIHAK